MNQPDEPDYTSIALPAREKQAKSGKSRIRRHPRVFVVLILFLIAGVAAAGLGGTVLVRYYDEAKTYDLASIAEVEAGAQALDRRGDPMGRISLQDRRLITLDQVPRHLIDALIATEDSRFFDHDGYDMIGIARAAWANLKARRIEQGGSTITQQLARHAFSLRGRTFDRKLRELFLAQRIESAFTKDEILEHYLNRVYFGCGYWGVGAAARGYFGKDVSGLTAPESAMLCAIIKSPNNLAPFVDPESAVKARNRTLAKMAAKGYLDEPTLREYQKMPCGALDETEREDRPNYLLTKVRLEALEILGRNRTLDGLVIRTTVDPRVQGRLADAIDRGARRIEARPGYDHETPALFRDRLRNDSTARPEYLQAAAVVIENATGQIVAAVGGRNYRDSQFNRVWDGRSPAGSVFFPFVYAAAFESGKVTPVSEVADAAMDNRRVMMGGTEGVLGEWATEDLGVSYLGKLTAGYGLVASKNGMTVRVGNRAGLSPVMELARNAGIQSGLRDFPNTFLGAGAVNLLEMTHACTVFPNLGWKTKRAHLISEITGRDGGILHREPVQQRSEQQVISPLTAARINQLLAANFSNGPARGCRGIIRGLKGAVAGKNGTAYDFTDNWFIGYNGGFTWGVWIGFDRPQTIYPGAFSKETALPIWLTMAPALDTPGDFPMPKGMFREATCLVSGHRATDRCRNAGPDSIVVDLPAAAPSRQEIARANTSTDPCPVHTDSSPPDGAVPAAVSPAGTVYQDVPPVEVKREVLTGHDPYGTITTAPPAESPADR